MAAFKYGSAQDLEFGTNTNSNFSVVENTTEEKTYQTEILVKDEDGDTTGLILGDARGTFTISGLADSTDFAIAGGTVLLGVVISSALEIIDGDAYITSIRSTRTNTDFQRFEITAVAFDGVEGAGA